MGKASEPAWEPASQLDGMPVTLIAEELAKKQKEISVAEFFERNKQLLGFDSPTKSVPDLLVLYQCFGKVQ